MIPLSHTSLPLSGQLCARLTRPERAHLVRTQSLETAEAPKPARNMLACESTLYSTYSRIQEDAGSYSQASSSDVSAVNSVEPCASVSDRLLTSNLAGSVSEWLDNFSPADIWLSESGDLLQTLLPIQVDKRPSLPTQQQAPRPPGKDPKQREDFYANIGKAIRTLKAEIPRLFQEDLTYDIYRDDIIFRDPRNFFQGKKDYQTIFWSLRFHGQLFFRLLYVDVLRIWESPENVKASGTVLKMRWTVHGVPRVPWDAEGIFDGISTFKVDSNGKIFEHAVNNVVLRDPPSLRNPILAGLSLARLAGQQQQQPCPGAWFHPKFTAQEECLEGDVERNLACTR